MTTMAQTNASTAIRRTPRGDSSEALSMAISPMVEKTIIRQE